MRMPRQPPPALPLGEDRLEFARIFALALSLPPTVEGHYLHWDELRHRPPPEGYSHEEWWRALKLQRRGTSREVPGLLSTSHEPFSYSVVPPMEAQLHQLSLQAGGTVRMPSQVSSDTRDQYIIRSLVEEAITSSQLEGAVTTREVAREMLRSGRQPRDRSERMVLNNFVTMQRIREAVGQPLTKALLLEVHSLVTDGTLDEPDGAGRFRLPTERRHVADLEGNVFHEPPPAEELEQRFESMAAFANDADGPFIHPVLRAITLHFWLAYDHPFVDGNGRTARALFYWAMLSHGYWLFEFLSISAVILRAPVQYYRAFVFTETDENDLTYFLLHQLDVIGKAVDSLHEYIERRSTELHETELLLRADLVLNHRQKDLVRHALRHPHAVYTIEGHAQSQSVAYGTARSDLLGMAEQGLFIKHRQGRRFTFAAAPGLRDRLSTQP